MGKVYFNAWSMDVKVEGENVVRNLDITTHNHASFVGNSPAWPYIDAMAMKPGGDCHDDVEREKEACKDCEPHKKPGKDPCAALNTKTKPPITGVSGGKAAPIADRLADNAAMDDCLSARKCLLQPYNRKTDDAGGKALGCCPPQTGHHLIEKASFFEGGQQIGTFPPKNSPKKHEPYDENMAPCVCAEGTSHNRGGTHELMHVFQKAANDAAPKGKLPVGGKQQDFPHVTTFGKAKESATEAFMQVFPTSGCNPECIKKQIDAYHNQCGITDSTRMKAVSEGISPRLSVTEAEEQAAERASKVLSDRASRGVTIE
jgi:HNH/endonuclease VII toxin of polymorphic toxin system